MEHEGTVRDEGALTAAAWAMHGGWLVMLQAHVVLEIVPILKGVLAVCAVGMLITIVFPKLLICIE